MLKKTKKLVFALSCLSLAVLAGAGFSALDGVFAGAETASADDLYISAGASVRTDEVVEDNEVVGYDTGIRFTANASADLVESLVETTGDTVTYKTGAELGMFIVPTSYMSDYTKYVKENDAIDYFDYFQTQKGKTKAQIAYTCNAEDLDAVNGVTYRVALMELLEKNYTRAYQSVAYYTLNGVTYYTEPSDSRTVSQVIDSALQATDVSFEDSQKSAMAGILERAIELRTHAGGTGANALHTVAVHGDKTLNLKSRFYEITASDIAFEIVSGDDVIAIEDGVVSALKADSTAKVKVTAYNGLVDFDVTVRTPSLGETEVIDFAAASDLSVANITNEGALKSVTYLDEFQGAQGVLKVDAKDWGHLGFDPLQSINAYTSAKYLVVRMWVDTTASDGFVYIGTDFSSADNKSMTSIYSGKWVNYYFKAKTFTNQWLDLGSYYSSLATNRAGQYYIDKIYVTNEAEVIDFACAGDVAFAKNQNSAPFSYEEEFNGAQGVLKINAGSWSEFRFTPIMSYTYTEDDETKRNFDNYADYNYLVIRMYSTVSLNMQIAGSNGTQLSGVRANDWMDVYFDGNAFKKQWNDTGSYYSSLIFKSAATIYIDKIYMTEELPEKLTVLDFSSEDSINYIDTSGDYGWDITARAYLPDYQDAQGVMSLTASGGYAIQKMKLGHISTEPLKGNYTHFVIRAYADTAVTSAYIRLGYSYTYSGNAIQQTVAVGEWKDYVFTMEEFDAFWANASYKGLRFGGAGTYYIDCMYFANL